MEHHLAQLNVARLHHPLGSIGNAEFVAALDPVNAIAEATPGFVWRLTDDDGQASRLRLRRCDRRPARDRQHLDLARSPRVQALRLQERPRQLSASPDRLVRATRRGAVVCWWIPVGEIPDTAEAYARLVHLRTHGPSAAGWPPTSPVAMPTPA